MGRGRRDVTTDETPAIAKPPRRPRAQPIPLDAISVLAGLAPGLILETDPLPAGVAGATQDEPSTVTVEEVGKLLRCGEATVRRLIRTAVLKPVDVDGRIHVRRSDIEHYRQSLSARAPGKPGE
jgi:hypothetical protein